MIIVTDLLIIDHFISMSLTLPYLTLVISHLNSLPYLIQNLNKYNLLPNVASKIAGWVANSVDPDEAVFAASHLGLHCLHRPVRSNTYSKVQHMVSHAQTHR